MKISDVYAALDRIAPFDGACEWDNCGIICGDPEGKVTRLLVALDADLAALKSAKERGCELVVSHHPPVFEPLRALGPRDAVYHYAAAGVAVISAHTNLDAADGGINDLLAGIAGIKDPQKLFSDGAALGRYGKTDFGGSARDYVKALCAALDTHATYTLSRPIDAVCVVSGSGGSLLEAAADAGCDTLVTGECKHDRLVQAENLCMNVIALGHFETENIIVKPLAERLNAELDGVEAFASDRRRAAIWE